jgi:hypothetical protein
MESSRGSLRFDEFPTSMKATQSLWIARNTPIGFRKRKTVRVSFASPLARAGRKDSAVRVSLSSYHNVKEPSRPRQIDAGSRTPNGSKSSIGSQRQPQRLPRVTRSNSAPVRRIARPHMVPQEVGATRAKSSFKSGPFPCQGAGNLFSALVAFHLDRGIEATFLPECVVTMHSLTAW